MTEVKILIVVNNTDAGSAYAQELSAIGVAYDIVPSFHEMYVMAVESSYNGLIIDILTLVRCSKEEKVIAYECINLFPVLRVKWEARHKQIQLSPLEQAFCSDVNSTLRFFIENRCGSFPARTLRRHQRKPLILNLLLSTDAGFPPEHTERTFSVNLSLGGVFLHTMQHLGEGDAVWLRFTELNDQAPLAASVRWSIPWGQERSIPGVGVKFETLSEGQQKALHSILNL